MNTYCKICKKQINGKETHIWVRAKISNDFGQPCEITYSQCYHNECFESIAGLDFSHSIKQCALCEERVQRANGTSTICESCIKGK